MSNVLVEFLVTSIEVNEGTLADSEKYGAGAKNVEFIGTILAEPNDRDMVYLMDVKKMGGPDTEYYHEEILLSAVQVSEKFFVDKLVEKKKKVLACIHGFQTEPYSWIDKCNQIQNNQNFNHIVVPVIWPSVGRPYWTATFSSYYKDEQKVAYTAGKAFNAITAYGRGKISLSLMCHSMGNRVLLSYAQTQALQPAKKFDQIFMVAADVWEEVFNERVIKGESDGMMKWRTAGLKLCRMVNRKIHAVHFEGDDALWWSSAQNGWTTHTRLGRFGSGPQKVRGRLNTECEKVLVDYDMAPFQNEILAVDSGNEHTYMHVNACVKYYNDQMNS